MPMSGVSENIVRLSGHDSDRDIKRNGNMGMNRNDNRDNKDSDMDI